MMNTRNPMKPTPMMTADTAQRLATALEANEIRKKLLDLPGSKLNEEETRGIDAALDTLTAITNRMMKTHAPIPKEGGNPFAVVEYRQTGGGFVDVFPTEQDAENYASENPINSFARADGGIPEPAPGVSREDAFEDTVQILTQARSWGISLFGFSLPG